MTDLDKLAALEAQAPEWLDTLRRLNSVRVGDAEGTVRFGAAINMQTVAAAHVHEVLTMINRLEREVSEARGERDDFERRQLAICELFADQNESLSTGHIETMATTLEKIWGIVSHD